MLARHRIAICKDGPGRHHPSHASSTPLTHKTIERGEQLQQHEPQQQQHEPQQQQEQEQEQEQEQQEQQQQQQEEEEEEE